MTTDTPKGTDPWVDRADGMIPVKITKRGRNILLLAPESEIKRVLGDRVEGLIRENVILRRRLYMLQKRCENCAYCVKGQEIPRMTQAEIDAAVEASEVMA